MHKFLLGLTSTPNSDWRRKIEEAKKFDITEVALFPTCLEIDDRKELYQLLEDSPIKSIPHVHLREDHKEWELDLLFEKYGTRLFNLHANEKCRVTFEKLAKYNENIYFENHSKISELFLDLLDKSAGICVDFAHWKNDSEVRKIADYEKFPEILGKYKIGCCHISGFMDPIFIDTEDGSLHKDRHYISRSKDLEYMKDFTQYLPKYCSMELGNSFEEQLGYREYLKEIVSRKSKV